MIDKKFTYQEEIEKELYNLTLPKGSKPKALHILKSFDEYKPEDFKKLYILFSIEGGHAFYSKEFNNDRDIHQILKDFSAFVKSKPGQERLVLYITPSHLTPNIFINHAYGNKMLAKGKFIPIGKGITGEGEQFLDRIVEEGLLIDVKHMSLISRQQFYKKEKWNKKPLIFSHGGVTGISWEHKLDSKKAMYSIKEAPDFVKIKYKKPKGILKGTLFNPISINLYDEDIIKILKSNGLIGISMDLRIIGGERNILNELKLNEKEFLSELEYEEWLNQLPRFAPLVDRDFEIKYDSYPRSRGEISDKIWDEEDRQDEFEELNTLLKSDIKKIYSKYISYTEFSRNLFKERTDEHLRFFVNQIFHIVIVAKNAKPPIDPWEHICIGSDFDGFVRTIDCCKNAAELNKFADDLIASLPGLAKEVKITLPRPAKNLIEDIFFNNSHRLMKEHFLIKPTGQTKANKKRKPITKKKSKKRWEF